MHRLRITHACVHTHIHTQVKDAIPVLQEAVANSTDKDVLMDTCWALSYLSDGDDARIEAVAASGVVVNLVQLLR